MSGGVTLEIFGSIQSRAIEKVLADMNKGHARISKHVTHQNILFKKKGNDCPSMGWVVGYEMITVLQNK